MKFSLSTAVILTSLLFSSCVLAVGTGEAMDDQGLSSKEASSDMDQEAHPGTASTSKSDQAKKTKKGPDLEGLEIDLRLAQMDLAANAGSVERSTESARHNIALAERDLRLAQEELAHYIEIDRELSHAESDLSLDRSRGRLEDTRAELVQLINMYKDEEFATSTKELVLTRGKRGLEQSERSMELAEKRASDKREFELARKQAGLEHNVKEANRNLRLKAQALATAEAEGDGKTMRAQNKVRLAEKKLQEAVDGENK
jgi:hypothetical protein